MDTQTTTIPAGKRRRVHHSWTPAARAKRAATLAKKRKEAAKEKPTKGQRGFIPLDAVPDAPVKKKKRVVDHTAELHNLRQQVKHLRALLALQWARDLT